jgi:hypothetical protein
MVRLAGRAALFAAAILPWVAWNRVRFGEWLPISARLKSSFPHWDPAASLDVVLHSSLNAADVAMTFLALGGGVLWLARGMRGRPRAGPVPAPTDAPGTAMTILALALVARLAWLLLWSRLDVQGSYVILAHPFVALAALVLAARAAGSRGLAVAALALALVGLGLLGGKLRASLPSVRAIAAGDGDEWALGRRIHDTVAPDEVIYGGAFGLIGYIADRAWINGDGVANTRAYQQAIHDGRLAQHLAARSVDHVVMVTPPTYVPPPGAIPITAESLLLGGSDAIEVRGRDIVFGSRMRRNAGSMLWLVRWAGTQASPDSLPRQPSR